MKSACRLDKKNMNKGYLKLSKALNKLPNNKYYFIAAALVIGILLIKVSVFMPMKRIKILDKNIARKEADLKELIILRGEYAVFKEQLKKVEGKYAQGASGTDCVQCLQAVYREQARPAVGDMSIEKDPKNKNACQVKFKNITLENLTKYLYLLESRQIPLIAKKIDISKKENSLDVILDILMLNNDKK